MVQTTARPRIGRRGVLSGLGGALLLLPLLPAPAAAAQELTGLAARLVRLAPMTLPSPGDYGFVRLQADLLLREGGTLARDLETVNTMRPRIVGRLTEALSQERPIARGASAADIARLKERMILISNDAIGAPLVEDVMIVSLLVS